MTPRRLALTHLLTSFLVFGSAGIRFLRAKLFKGKLFRTEIRNFSAVLLLSTLLSLAFSLSPFAPPAQALGGPQPELDQPAPMFTLPSNVEEGEVSLADYAGQWVVLYFYPRDFTPGCTLEAQRFQRDLPEYQARNAQIIGVSADDVVSHEEFCDSEGLVYPLLSDPDGAVSRAYGSWMKPMSMRHTYLIDPDGVLKERFLGVRPAIHSAEVLARLDELQA